MTKLLAILGAIKEIASVIRIVKQAYDKWKEAKIHKHYEEKKRVLDNVTKEIEDERKKPKEEQDDKRLIDLHRKLVNLGDKQLSELQDS